MMTNNDDLYSDLNLEPMSEAFKLVWNDLALSTVNIPATQWLVPGLITVGESTLLIASPKKLFLSWT